MKKGITGLDIIKALIKHGFEDIAENLFQMMKHKVTGDLLQTSAIVTPRIKCCPLSGISSMTIRVLELVIAWKKTPRPGKRFSVYLRK